VLCRPQERIRPLAVRRAVPPEHFCYRHIAVRRNSCVISDANSFAQSKGKVAIRITTHETPLEVGRQFSTFDYQFKLVDPNPPEARSTVLIQRPNVVIERNEKSNVDVQVNDKSDKPKDLYTELLKLDDLHKRGILSDQEFEAQKKKLQSEN